MEKNPEEKPQDIKIKTGTPPMPEQTAKQEELKDNVNQKTPDTIESLKDKIFDPNATVSLLNDHKNKSDDHLTFPSTNKKTAETNILYKQNKPKFKLWVLLSGLFLLIILTIGGISLYKGDIYWVRDMMGFGLPSNPNKAIEKVAGNMAALKGYKSDFSLNLVMNLDNEKVNANINGKGEYNNSSKENKIDLKIGDISTPEITESDKEMLDEIKKLETSIITTKDEIFIKIEDEWIKLKTGDFTTPQKLTNKSKDINENFSRLTGSIIYSNGVSKSGVADFDNLGNMVKSVKKLKDEKVSGSSTYHFNVEIDLAKALDTDESFKSIPDFQKSIIREMISKYITLKMDFWITKKDLLIKKHSGAFDISINASDFGGEGIVKINLNFDETLKDYNEPITINKPKDATEINEEMIMGLFNMLNPGGLPIGGEDIFGESTQEITRDSRRKADLNQIRTALEMYADDNNGKYPAKSDNSQDGIFLTELNNYIKIPLDPSHPTYYYSYQPDGSSYKLTCVLENPNDTDGKKSGNLNIYTLTN